MEVLLVKIAIVIVTLIGGYFSSDTVKDAGDSIIHIVIDSASNGGSSQVDKQEGVMGRIFIEKLRATNVGYFLVMKLGKTQVDGQINHGGDKKLEMKLLAEAKGLLIKAERDGIESLKKQKWCYSYVCYILLGDDK